MARGLVGWTLTATAVALVSAQQPAPALKNPVEKLGPNLLRVGQIVVDTAKREATVPGRVNQVMVLEFVANSRGGAKAYESALTLETDAVTFNLALLLMGLDKAHGKAPSQHFDQAAAIGDPVEIWVEIEQGGERRRLPVEQLLYDKATERVIPPGRWVYTGSTFTEDGAYLAEAHGVLIGFVHSPSSIIELAAGAGMGRYGSIVLNPSLGLTSLSPVSLTVKAVELVPGRH